jgi:hypothetical protein
LIGPVIGAVIINALKSWATRAYPDLWLMFLGMTFILVTLFMPKGIVGLPAQLKGLKQRYLPNKSAKTEADPIAAEPLPAAPRVDGLSKSNNK